MLRSDVVNVTPINVSDGYVDDSGSRRGQGMGHATQCPVAKARASRSKAPVWMGHSFGSLYKDCYIPSHSHDGYHYSASSNAVFLRAGTDHTVVQFGSMIARGHRRARRLRYRRLSSRWAVTCAGRWNKRWAVPALGQWCCETCTLNCSLPDPQSS
jgi:hypothetical protein